MWYFAISDCNDEFYAAFQDSKYNRVKLEWDIHMKNVGKTEFSVEQFGI